MHYLAVIGVPLIVAWGLSVGYRCIAARSRIWVGVGVALAACWYTLALVAGGTWPMAAAASVACFALVIELLLGAGIVPSVRRLRPLFVNLPLDMRILAARGREVYRTRVARQLDATTLAQLSAAASDSQRAGVTTEHSQTLPNTAFKLFRLQAGVAAIAEDVSELAALQQEMSRQNELIESQNEVLRNHQAMRAMLYRQQRERELSACVEKDLASTTAQIRTILDNRLAATGPGSERERLNQLNLVKVLVAYSKRKGMLALAGAESATMDGEQLEVIAREAMADLQSIGIECAVLVAAHAPIAMPAVNTVYDSFYDCIISVLPRANPVLMIYISQDADGALAMRATIECAMGLDSETAVELIPRIATSTEQWTSIQMGIAHELEGRLATRGGDYSIGLEDGLVNVTVRAGGPESPGGLEGAGERGAGA